MSTSELIDICRAYLEDYCEEAVASLTTSGKRRLVLSWNELSHVNHELADDLISNPEVVYGAFTNGFRRAEFSGAVEGALDDIDRNTVSIAFTDFAERRRSVTSLRHDDVGKHVSLEVQVETHTQVEPRIVEAAMECQRCGTITYESQAGEKISSPNECQGCERQGPFDVNDAKSRYEDHQLVEISDPPEVAEGASDSIVAELKGDLAGRVSAGDRIFVNGILETKTTVDERSPSRRRPLWMTAKSVESTSFGFEDLTTERVDEIKELASRDDIYELLIGSIAPHIMTGERGDVIKLSLALQLFGGVERDFETGYKRGNINLLLVGTPGTAKSQYLNAVNRIAPRSIKVSGKGARPAGMTATAVQSEMTGEWTLKAGALVKASGGLACIDEFDKMAPETTASLHEALEDQEISVAKADINTTVPAKASVLAAANPKNGVYDRFRDLAEQISIGPTIISRFDLIYGLQDTANEERDRATARHQHDVADPEIDDPDPAIEHDLLTEYIAYARQNVFPSYESPEVRDDLVEFYVEKRQQAIKEERDDIRPISPRVNELLRRVAQASARARLSDVITFEDTTRVKDLFRQTIGEVGLTSEGVIDGNKLDGGFQAFTQNELIKNIIATVSELEPEHDNGVPREALLDALEEKGADRERAGHQITRLHRDGDLTEPSSGRFRAV